MIGADRRAKILAYLRDRHPRGVTPGEVRGYVLTNRRTTAREIRACLDGLAAEGLAIVGEESRRFVGTYRVTLRVYIASAALMARVEPARRGNPP